MLMFNSTVDRLRLYIWITLASLAVFDAVTAYHFNIYYKFNAIYVSTLLLSWIFLLFSLVLRYKNKITLANLIEVILIPGIQGLLSLHFIYVCAILSRPFPYVDSYLIALNHFFNIDWFTYANWLDMHPKLFPIISLIYHSFIEQMYFIICILIIFQMPLRAYSFLLALLLASIICLAISIFVPNESPYTYLSHTKKMNFINKNFVSMGYVHIPALQQLRAGNFHEISDIKIGLLTFPSYHSACAILSIWGLWSFKWLKWPAIIFYSIMFYAIMIIGSHYLADIIAGVMVACICIKFVNSIANRNYLTGVKVKES